MGPDLRRKRVCPRSRSRFMSHDGSPTGRAYDGWIGRSSSRRQQTGVDRWRDRSRAPCSHDRAWWTRPAPRTTTRAVCPILGLRAVVDLRALDSRAQPPRQARYAPAHRAHRPYHHAELIFSGFGGSWRSRNAGRAQPERRGTAPKTTTGATTANRQWPSATRTAARPPIRQAACVARLASTCRCVDQGPSWVESRSPPALTDAAAAVRGSVAIQTPVLFLNWTLPSRLVNSGIMRLRNKSRRNRLRDGRALSSVVA